MMLLARWTYFFPVTAKPQFNRLPALVENSMYYIGLDAHKKTISYCVKEVSGQIRTEGTLQATRELTAG